MRSEPLLILILGAPSNHAGRNSILIWGVNRQGCRFSRPAPWMARGGGPPNPCRITGTPSLSEVPSGGARTFCLLLRFSKVSRCKSGTYSGRYLNNGYVPGPKTQPPVHIVDVALSRSKLGRLPHLDLHSSINNRRPLNPLQADASPEQEIRAHALGPDANGSAVWSPSPAY